MSLIFAAALAVAAQDSIYGFVRASGTAEPVATACVREAGAVHRACADSAGRYVLRGLDEGRHALRFESLGYEPVSLVVLLRGVAGARVDVDLTPAPLVLEPMIVSRSRRDAFAPAASDPAAPGEWRLDREGAARDPLVGSPEIHAALAAAPAVTGRPEATSALRLLGGSGSENLVLVDGIPWRGAQHVGGLAGTLPDAAVDAIDLHANILPARFGDALAGVVAVRTRQGDTTPRFQGRIDPSTAQLALSGPLLNGATLLVAGRGAYRPAFGPAGEAGKDGNGYDDLFSRVSIPIPGGALDLYGIVSRDRLTFPATIDSTGGHRSQPGGGLNNSLGWDGALGGGIWRGALGDRGGLTARLWISALSARGLWDTLAVTSRLRELGVGAEYQRTATSGTTVLGFSMSRTQTRYRVSGIAPIASVDAGLVVAAVFAQSEWRVTPAWTVSGGLRVSAAGLGGLRAEPRFWTRVAVGHGRSVSAGYSRQFQYVQSAGNDETLLDALARTDFPLATGGVVRPSRADAISGELVQVIGGRSAIRLRGYARWLHDVVVTAPSTSYPFATAPAATGWGRSSGLDLSADHDGKRFGATLRIGFVVAEREVPQVEYRLSMPQQHAVAGVRYRLPSLGTFRAALWLGAATPTTPLQSPIEWQPYAPFTGGEIAGTPSGAAGALNAWQLPAYARLDFGFSREWRIAFHGLAGRLGTSVELSNVLNRKNVLAYATTASGSQPLLLRPRSAAIVIRWQSGR